MSIEARLARVREREKVGRAPIVEPGLEIAAQVGDGACAGVALLALIRRRAIALVVERRQPELLEVFGDEAEPLELRHIQLRLRHQLAEEARRRQVSGRGKSERRRLPARQEDPRRRVRRGQAEVRAALLDPVVDDVDDVRGLEAEGPVRHDAGLCRRPLALAPRQANAGSRAECRARELDEPRAHGAARRTRRGAVQDRAHHGVQHAAVDRHAWCLGLARVRAGHREGNPQPLRRQVPQLQLHLTRAGPHGQAEQRCDEGRSPSHASGSVCAPARRASTCRRMPTRSPTWRSASSLASAR